MAATSAEGVVVLVMTVVIVVVVAKTMKIYDNNNIGGSRGG